uniref:Uncharacterized protein n=1 Tax=Rhizophora mucronata TaxID=61149 RepID=A0A2P2QJE8_RHIMU
MALRQTVSFILGHANNLYFLVMEPSSNMCYIQLL